MGTIGQEDLIQPVADAFQFISYYHPVDFLGAMGEAYEKERSPAAKNAIGQILVNSRMAAEGQRPICQDTGIAVVFLKIGMDVRWDARLSVQQMVDEGVRRAYTDKDNPLRASVLADPDGARKSTRDNTPAVVHMEVVPGDAVEVKLAAKGGGSEEQDALQRAQPERRRSCVDPRPGTDEDYYELIGDDSGVFGCMSLLACHDLCPKDLPLQTQIAFIRRKMVRQGLK